MTDPSAPTPTSVDTTKRATGHSDSGVSYWQLVWRRFSKNKLAMASLIVVALFYLTMVAFPEFISPHSPGYRARSMIEAPPMRIHFIDNEGSWSLRPFVYLYDSSRDPRSLRRVYAENRDKKAFLYLFVRSTPYRLFGVWETDIHLFGNPDVDIFPLGTDGQGRCMLSRIVHAGRISLTVGLVGVAISLVVGTIVGIISGYLGGRVDSLIQRFIEILMSFPSIPLWMSLAAAIPRHWSIVTTFFAITMLLSLINWGGLARQVRGLVLSLKERDFVSASRAMGVPTFTIVLRHLLPNCISHIIVVATIAIPKMVIGETSLSFLGIGLRAPALSWGVLLQDAQNINTIAITPWLMLPTIPLFVIVLAFNALGDGLRDAADPYTSHKA